MSDDQKNVTLAWINALHAKSEAESSVTYQISELKEVLVGMLKYVPKEKLQIIGAHLNELEVLGTEYGSHYDFTTLTTPLDVYSKKTPLDERPHTPEEFQWQIDYWTTEVRDGQRRTVQHVAHEYCRPDRSFQVLPTFQDDWISGVGRTDWFRNYNLNTSQRWRDEVESDGFLNIAIVNGSARPDIHGAQGLRWVDLNEACLDCAAIRHLGEIRSKEFNELVDALNHAFQQEQKPFKTI